MEKIKKKIEIDSVVKSKRTWGGILVIVALIAQGFGYEFGIEEQKQTANILLDGITAGMATIGGLLSIFSKVKETKKVKEAKE